MTTSFDYDLVVIGGGSGGLACGKEAAQLGATVCLFDYVKPSPQGTKWGLGGTCVNVGCVPKKLMHYAAEMGLVMRHEAQVFGWMTEGSRGEATGMVVHEWDLLVQTVQRHIKSLNFSQTVSLRSNKVKYINALASFKDAHTLEYTLKDKVETMTAKFILIAVGGRPSQPSISPGVPVPGGHLAITSDDIFALQCRPGKTLVVGASYIALECAGMLSELGYEVSVAVRSILLRGFDRQCAEKVGAVMRESGVRFIGPCVPIKLDRCESGKIKVNFEDRDGPPFLGDGIPVEPHNEIEEFDTVLYAVGRTPDTEGLNLQNAGVEVLRTGKIQIQDGSERERTSVPHIYAVGDVLDGVPELTPSAIKAGQMLAKRLFMGAKQQMDYINIATTVFTPAEYGCVGMSEEQATVSE
eukprot:GHVN01105611.1.p1 GENE.GHVN01105611.1~~GHVN01105611.1.p1  ORF type:complete len:462 (-),score=115.01 GHVN01105611.1:193-1425(-)